MNFGTFFFTISSVTNFMPIEIARLEAFGLGQSSLGGLFHHLTGVSPALLPRKKVVNLLKNALSFFGFFWFYTQRPQVVVEI